MVDRRRAARSVRRVEWKEKRVDIARSLEQDDDDLGGWVVRFYGRFRPSRPGPTDLLEERRGLIEIGEGRSVSLAVEGLDRAAVLDHDRPAPVSRELSP